MGLHLRGKGQGAWLIYSFISSALVFLLGFILPRPPYLGIFQRAALASFFVWLAALCIRALRHRA
jgi:hypothetical protein